MIDREKEELFKRIYQLQIGPNKEDRIFVDDRTGVKKEAPFSPFKEGVRVSLDNRVYGGPKFSIQGLVKKRKIGNTIRQIFGQDVKTKFNERDIQSTYKE